MNDKINIAVGCIMASEMDLNTKQEVIASLRDLQSENTRLKAELDRANDECKQIDENAAAVQKEYKAEIERLQSAYLRAVTERDNAIFQLTRREAERDKAVEDLEKYAHAIHTCIHKNSPDCYVKSHDFCQMCPAWQWRGLEQEHE